MDIDDMRQFGDTSGASAPTFGLLLVGNAGDVTSVEREEKFIVLMYSGMALLRSDDSFRVSVATKDGEWIGDGDVRRADSVGNEAHCGGAWKHGRAVIGEAQPGRDDSCVASTRGTVTAPVDCSDAKRDVVVQPARWFMSRALAP